MNITLDANKAAAELCRRQFKFFVKEFWDVIIAEPLVWNWHMDILCEEIQKVYERVFLQEITEPEGSKRMGRLPKLYDLIINIPPGTSKSTLVSVMAPAWSWTRDPSMRHITGSYSSDVALEMATKSRDIIKSDKYQLYFPEVEIKKDEDGKTNYKNTRNGQRYSTSTGGTITGIHGHIITIDDPLSTKQAVSQAEVDNATYWFDQTLPTRKVDKAATPTILIMQRLSVKDPSGHLLSKKNLPIRHICLPATVSENVRPLELKEKYTDGLLDPVRMNFTVLAEMKAKLGSAGYAGQFDQVPVPDGGLIWKKWFIEVPDEVFPSLTSMTSVGTDWDTAYTKDDDNAGSAYVRAGRIGGKMFIDDLGVVYMEFPELVKFMREQKAPHYVESKASGKSLKQALTKLKIPTIEVKVEGGADKIARAKMASPYAEAGMCYIRKSLADFLYNDSRQGILNFPKGTHADLADVLAQAINRIFKGSMVVGKPNHGDSVLDYL